MATVELTPETFENTVAKDGITLIDFWASWCGPCRMFAPTYDAASEKHEDITFTKFDTEAHNAFSGALGIQSIPTIWAFRDGVLLFQQAGVLPPEALDQLIGALEAVDMDEVRAKLEAQKAEQAADAPAGGAEA
ncbi:MAG: thioredoxin family protein [Pseudoclavibacter sp.]